MSLASWKVRAGLPAALVLALMCASPALGQTHRIGGGGGGGGLGGGSGGDTINPPVITSLTAVQIPGQKFHIAGTVADNNLAACAVTLTGAATGTLQCDASGNFAGDFAVATLGNVTAVANDGQNSSALAGVTLANAAPTITVQATQSGNTWTFSGTVGDEAPAGLTVTLTGPPGVNGQTATVGANGAWSVSVQLPDGTGGNVTATVTDWYGQTGNGYTSF